MIPTQVIVCPKCNDYLGSCGTNIALHCKCGHTVPNAFKSESFFMTLGMKAQTRELFSRDEIVQGLRYKFEREKDANTLNDLLDGKLYQKLSEAGMPLSNENNISISFNTDGVPLGKSSDQQLWPIYITINELPPKLRAKHMLSGLVKPSQTCKL